MFAELIRQKLGGGERFVGILSNGTSGDVNNVNFAGPPPGKREPGSQCRVVADAGSTAAKKAADGATYSGDLALRIATTDIELAVRKPTAEEIKRAEEILARAKGRDLKGIEEVYARETVLLAKYPDRVRLRIQVIRVGDLAVVAISCEVFTEFGLEIKKRSPLKRTFTVSLANGYNGSLPTPAHHALGGYETWRARPSYLEVNASDKILRTVFHLLGSVSGK